MRETVYIETTIPSCLTEHPSRDIFQLARQSITRKWWETKRRDYDLVTSGLTVTECKRGDPEAAQRRLECIKGISLVETGKDVHLLSKNYMDLLSIPEDCGTDMLHLATCAMNQIDYLLTWNCKNLGSFTMLKIQKYNNARGLHIPVLVTPEAFFDEREFSHELV